MQDALTLTTHSGCLTHTHTLLLLSCRDTHHQVVNLGTFDTAEDAARVWNEAAALFRGKHTRFDTRVSPPAGSVFFLLST